MRPAWGKQRVKSLRRAPEAVEGSKETSMKHAQGIKVSSDKKVMQPTGQVKCLYVSTENYNQTAITETCWDESYDWSVAV